MKLVLIGPPAAGKGTLAEKLADHYNIPHISTGDIFRTLYAEKNPIGIEAHDKYWGDGNLVPDELTTKLLQEELGKEKYQRGFLLDGYPRTGPQADTLDEIAKGYIPIILDAEEDELISRSDNRRICSNSDCKTTYSLRLDTFKKEGYCNKCDSELTIRADESKIRKRIEDYFETKGWIDNKYSGVDVINANNSPDKIFQDTLRYIDSQNS